MDETDSFNLIFLIDLIGFVLLIIFSLIDSALNRLTPFDLKLLNEQKGDKHPILAILAQDSLKISVPLNFVIQLNLLIVFIVTTYLIFQKIHSHQLIWTAIILLIIIFAFLQVIPQLVTHNNPDKKFIFFLPALAFIFPLIRIISFPIMGLMERVKREKEITSEESPEVMDKKIEALIAIGKEEEVLEREESEMVKSVLEFGDTKVREIMTPRSQIIALPETATIKETKDLMVRTKHSRIPVYRDNLDNIVGIIYVRNLLTRIEEKGWTSPISDLLIPPVFVSEEQPLSEVFKEIKKKHAWMVFVKNEYGGISGLITIEDLIEEIVGEISDEDQTENQEIIPQGDDSFLVSGSVSLYKLSEVLGITFEDEDCQTIGGLVTKSLGSLPKRNDRIELSGISVVVLSVDSRKVNRLLIRKKTNPEKIILTSS